MKGRERVFEKKMAEKGLERERGRIYIYRKKNTLGA